MSSNDGPGAESAAFPANSVEEALARALEQTRDDDGPAEGTPDAASAPDQGPASETPEEVAGAVASFISALREGDLWIPLPEGSGVQDEDRKSVV